MHAIHPKVTCRGSRGRTLCAVACEQSGSIERKKVGIAKWLREKKRPPGKAKLSSKTGKKRSPKSTAKSGCELDGIIAFSLSLSSLAFSMAVKWLADEKRAVLGSLELHRASTPWWEEKSARPTSRLITARFCRSNCAEMTVCHCRVCHGPRGRERGTSQGHLNSTKPTKQDENFRRLQRGPLQCTDMQMRSGHQRQKKRGVAYEMGNK